LSKLPSPHPTTKKLKYLKHNTCMFHNKLQILTFVYMLLFCTNKLVWHSVGRNIRSLNFRLEMEHAEFVISPTEEQRIPLVHSIPGNIASSCSSSTASFRDLVGQSYHISGFWIVFSGWSQHLVLLRSNSL
jgi:hypothetical protein